MPKEALGARLVGTELAGTPYGLSLSRLSTLKVAEQVELYVIRLHEIVRRQLDHAPAESVAPIAA